MKKKILFVAFALALIGGVVSSSSAKLIKPIEPIACCDDGTCTVDGGTYSYKGIFLK